MGTDVLKYVLAFAAGMAVGGGYFTGLWVTVRRLPFVRHPGAWVLGSFVVRAGVTLLSFYAVLQEGWPLLASSLAGFVLVRVYAVNRLKPVFPADGPSMWETARPLRSG